jgi:hypothetical protein
MKSTDKLKQEIYIALKKEINNSKNKFIELTSLFTVAESSSSDMPVFLQSPEGQYAFSGAIGTLFEEQIISPVGKKPNHNGLYIKYRINKENEKKDNQLITEIVKNIVFPAVIDYYVKHTEDYFKDKDVIDVISGYLKKKDDSIVTVNERAYELFGDEKFFRGDEKSRSRGEIVLKRLGLNYLHLGCIETVEPFFSFYKKDFHLKHSRNIYIIENKDTFWTVKKHFMDSVSNIDLDMLIYGEGKKILSSFRFIDEYEIDLQADTFYYFGDLDAEGINIYCDLKAKFPEYNIRPFKHGYQAVLEIGMMRNPAKTPKQQKVSENNIEKFIEEFDDALAIKIKNIINGGLYIPQEALSATMIKERFGNLRNV